MTTYCAFVTKIEDIRVHPKADRIRLGTCYGNQVVVGLDTKSGDRGIYFPTDGALSTEFMKANDLIAIRDAAGKKIGGGFFEENGRVRTQKFRGEKSDGFWIPLVSLSNMGIDIESLEDGFTFTEIDGKKICSKYIPVGYRVRRPHVGAKKTKEIKYPTFHEHQETDQLAYRLSELAVGDTLVITEKLHGTSGRTGKHIETSPPDLFSRVVNKIVGSFTKKQFIGNRKVWKTITGTRRVVIKDFERSTGYYGDNNAELFRKQVHNLFKNKLQKGETVYYEIVGFTTEGRPLMGKCDNTLVDKALEDRKKTFEKTYGPTTVFNYGCPVGEHEVYIYRMSMTNKDGVEIDYTWDMVCDRAKTMGINTVPYLTKIVYDGDSSKLMKMCEALAGGRSTIAPHIREGVVVRVDSSHWKAFKHKSFEFKVLEGIIKVDQMDEEESQSAPEEELQ